MRLILALLGAGEVALLTLGVAGPSALRPTVPPGPGAYSTANVGVGPQYDSTHVYVAPEDFDRFVASFVATFGGTASKQGVFTVMPTPSKTTSQSVMTPVGIISVFGFKTPIPHPFGSERTGDLVSDLDEAVSAARATGADVLVSPFNDPIGRDAIIQWPGGVNTQLYWHTTAPNYKPLETIPENRVMNTAIRNRNSPPIPTMGAIHECF
jgi:hypothetical protein